MHLLIPFASTLAEGCAHTLRDLQLPALARLLARLEPTVRLGTDEASLSPPHELALAAALGWQGVADGCLPWAAWQAAIDGLAGSGDDAWGLLTPVHWRVSAEGVELVDPAALALGADESRALLAAVAPHLEHEGWRTAWGAPLRWYGVHPSLRDLPCASPDRVIGRAVDAWMAPDARLARVRRLQSEVQMLLYRAEVNDRREARGALPVNSFWLHGCGLLQPAAATADALQIDDRLHGPALAQEWAAWAEGWRALDAGPVAGLLRRAEGGERAISLTLCGERFAQRFEPARSQGLWTRFTRRLSAPPPATIVEAL